MNDSESEPVEFDVAKVPFHHIARLTNEDFVNEQVRNEQGDVAEVAADSPE